MSSLWMIVKKFRGKQSFCSLWKSSIQTARGILPRRRRGQVASTRFPLTHRSTVTGELRQCHHSLRPQNKNPLKRVFSGFFALKPNASYTNCITRHVRTAVRGRLSCVPLINDKENEARQDNSPVLTLLYRAENQSGRHALINWSVCRIKFS